MGDGINRVDMKSYYRIMLGRKSRYADEAYNGNFISAGFLRDVDLTNALPEDWRDFNAKFIPVFLEQNPGKKKIAAGLACGMLWTVAKEVQVDDVLLCPDGKGEYYVGQVTGPYFYVPDHDHQHRRPVQWYPRAIARSEMSDALRNATGSAGTVVNITKYADEIERLVAGPATPSIVATDETIEDPSVFALEKHLEDFLVQNWKSTELGKHYTIYAEEEGVVGQQYPTDTGPIDILATSKDGKELLVVELKKGRASDVVVGQVQRYMGYVKEELAEEGQAVRGVIIALQDDLKLRRALSVAPNIDFYTYKVQFRLEKPQPKGG